MAKSSVKCASESCSEVITFHERNRKEADRKAKWAEGRLFCSGCKEKQRDLENQQAAEQNASAGLPLLTGSEKQVLWAESIRAMKLAHLQQMIDGKLADDTSSPLKAGAMDDPTMAAAIERIRCETAASWWIDNRDVMMQSLFQRAYKAVQAEPPPKIKEAAADAKAEATIYPESPVSKLVTEIAIKDDVVAATLAEKNEDFRQLIRYELNYAWSGTCWQRTIRPTAGTIEDRAAELGHRLLAAGFPIRVFDEQIRARAISGQYEPECRRWILRRETGDYAGWFAIKWWRPDDFYEAAKRVRGARYDQYAVVVPSDNFEEVADFASMYGFQLDDDARQLMTEAEQTKAAALIAPVQPVKNKNRKGEKPATKPQALEVEEADIDPALIDDEYHEDVYLAGPGAFKIKDTIERKGGKYIKDIKAFRISYAGFCELKTLVESPASGVQIKASWGLVKVLRSDDFE